MKGIFTSRKFWATLAAIASSVGAVVAGEITWAQAIAAIVTATTAYTVATGVQKIGSK